MTFLRLVFYTFFISALLVTPASAEPVSAAFFAVVGWIKAGSIISKIVVTIAINAASSVLTKMMKKKPVPSGIKVERTLTGGTNSRGVLLGFYATAGSQVCPPMSHGQADKTPNAYLTQVIALSDFKTTDLTGVIVMGERIPFSKVGGNEYGWPLAGKYSGKAWVKFYDGRQMAADPMLVSRYGSYVRPWQASRIGSGVSYAIMTYLYDTDVFKGEPDVRFELQGAPFYDPRFDSSVGGAGAQRWDDQTTWAYTLNPVVMIYNILRGIEIAPGQTYGGNCEFEDLPLASWVAAMNVCDEVVVTTFGDEPRYRAGYEIAVAEEQPADVIEELLKACSASISEIGGVYKIRCGPPALPVYFMTDEDILVSEDRDFDPYPTIDGSMNAIYGAFPHPGENWVTHDAPPMIDAAYLAQDDGVEQSADLQFPAVPFPLQVQRNMMAWLHDDRRWRRHNLSMGPYALALEPLDVVSWTSQHNGYEDKLFEVGLQGLDLQRLSSVFSIREVDPNDYNWTSDDELPDPVSPGTWVLPVAQAVPGWAVAASSVKDNDETDRRPALLCSWASGAAEDAKFLKIEVRLATTQEMVATLIVPNEPFAVPDEEEPPALNSYLVSEGILPNTSYEARAQYVADRPTLWSSWLGAVTGDIKLTDADVIMSFPDGTTPIWVYATLSDLPLTADEGTFAYVEDEGVLYVYQDSAWGPLITPSSGIPHGTTLPASGEYGDLFYNETDGKLYRWNGTGWTAAVAASDVTGQIVETQISNNAVSAPKIAAGAVTTDKLFAGAVTADKILAGAVTAAKLDVGAVTANAIASNAVTADKILAGAVTAAKINVTALSAITANLGTITAGSLSNPANTTLLDLNAGLLRFTKASRDTRLGPALGNNLTLWSGSSSVPIGSEDPNDTVNTVLAIGPTVPGGGVFWGRTLSGPFDPTSTVPTSHATPGGPWVYAVNVVNKPVLINGRFVFWINFTHSGTGSPDGEGYAEYQIEWQIVTELAGGADTVVVHNGTAGQGGFISDFPPMLFQQQPLYPGHLNTRSGIRDVRFRYRLTLGLTATVTSPTFSGVFYV